MKTLLISHIADNDGVSPIILLKLVINKFDYKLLEIYEVEDYVNDLIDSGKYKEYDRIYITDLKLTMDLCKKIDNIEELKNKLLVFDHHQSNLFVNDFDFATVIVKNEEGRMECGTSLFYKYLKNKYVGSVLNNNSVSEYVELVRENDTWDYLTENELKAKKLGMLFSLYNRERYIESIFNNLKNNVDELFTKEEDYLLNIEQERMTDYIESKKDKVYFGEINNYKVGIVFAENYRSVLGNYLSKYYKDKVDFIIIINFDHGISYRTINDVNVGEFAQIYGGGGHQKAAGSYLPKGMHKKVIELLYEGIKLNDEN